MHEYSSVSSSASDITMASISYISSSSNWNLSISSSSEEEDTILPRLQLVQEALAELAGWPRERPVGLDDQLAEGRVGLKSEAETRLYELDGSRLP